MKIDKDTAIDNVAKTTKILADNDIDDDECDALLQEIQLQYMLDEALENNTL